MRMRGSPGTRLNLSHHLRGDGRARRESPEHSHRLAPPSPSLPEKSPPQPRTLPLPIKTQEWLSHVMIEMTASPAEFVGDRLAPTLSIQEFFQLRERFAECPAYCGIRGTFAWLL